MTPTPRRALAALVLLAALPGCSDAPKGLRVVDAGWSSAGRATGVPPEQVAVGSEVGRATEGAYVRLTGEGRVLRLPVNPDRSLYPEDAALRVCRLASAGWTAGSPGAVVAHRDDDCAPVRVQDGAAVVDLSRWADRTDRTGFALLPALAGDPAPRTFRLVLDPAAP